MNLEIVTVEELKKLDISFDNVIGLQNLKEKAAFILKAKGSLPSQRVSMPKGIIFAGKPGCGKTFFGKILAKYLEYNFLYISAASLQSPVPGIGKSKVMKLFKQARGMKPCVLFLDEIDAVIKDRDTVQDADSGGILQQFLTELDGSADNSDIIVIAATNVLDSLDGAFTRSGRFDIKFNFDVPGKKERAASLYKLIGGNNPGVDLSLISEITEGLSYADLDAVHKLASEYAFMENSSYITNSMLIKAVRTIISGESSNKDALNIPSKRMYTNHIAAHTLAYGFFGTDFLTFSQITPGVKLECCPTHRRAVVHRASDELVKLASILCVKNIEAKQGASTNLYYKNDYPKIEDLSEKVVDMMSTRPITNKEFHKLVEGKVVSMITIYVNKLIAKHGELFELIEKKLTSSAYVTRKELVDLSNQVNIRKADQRQYREHLETKIKELIDVSLNEYEKSYGKVHIDVPTQVKEAEEVEIKDEEEVYPEEEKK